MTKIKFCGLSRICDIESVNEIMPEYIGFVFVSKSKRYITPDKAKQLKSLLHPSIQAVGVFVDEDINTILYLLKEEIIDIIQLHGHENETYIQELKQHAKAPIIQAFRIQSKQDIQNAIQSSADYILLDSGAGTGQVFDWELIQNVHRPYFLAGGLFSNNVKSAIQTLHPYAVDVSSGVETNGYKDKEKMVAFASAIRKDDKL